MSVAPDTADVSLGVSVTKPTAKEARHTAATAMEAVVESIKKNGVAEKDIVTVNVSLNPVYEYTGSSRRLDGYEFGNTVKVVVRYLDKVPAVVDDAVSAGATVVYGISFRLDNPTTQQAKARELAMADARAKADVLARIAGVHDQGRRRHLRDDFVVHALLQRRHGGRRQGSGLHADPVGHDRHPHPGHGGVPDRLIEQRHISGHGEAVAKAAASSFGCRRKAIGNRFAAFSSSGHTSAGPTAGCTRSLRGDYPLAMRLDLTMRADYAIRAVLALTKARGMMSSRKIADEMKIPPRFLPQIMGDLSRAGLVEAHPGRAGGYVLAKDPVHGDAAGGHRGHRGRPASPDLRHARHALRRGRRVRRPRHLLRGRDGPARATGRRDAPGRHRRLSGEAGGGDGRLADPLRRRRTHLRLLAVWPPTRAPGCSCGSRPRSVRRAGSRRATAPLRRSRTSRSCGWPEC